MYVIETDAPCRHCDEEHGYVTQMCMLAVFVDFVTAKYVSSAVSGSIVREINEVPEGISYTVYLHKNGRPDRAYPSSVASMPRG